jgi:hypothetical protein
MKKREKEEESTIPGSIIIIGGVSISRTSFECIIVVKTFTQNEIENFKKDQSKIFDFQQVINRVIRMRQRAPKKKVSFLSASLRNKIKNQTDKNSHATKFCNGQKF